MTTKSKKDARAIREVKNALDTALSDGLISQDVFDRLHVPGLRMRNKTFNWDTWDTEEIPTPPPDAEPVLEAEPAPEAEPVPEAEPIPEVEPASTMEDDDTVVVDASAPEVPEGISYTAAQEKGTEAGLVAGSSDRIKSSIHNSTRPEATTETKSA